MATYSQLFSGKCSTSTPIKHAFNAFLVWNSISFGVYGSLCNVLHVSLGGSVV